MAQGTKAPIEPGMIARLVAGVRYGLTGNKPEWFGPGDPLPPVAQEQAVGRRFDFNVLQNVRQRPRDGEAITFEQMRALSESCDVLRLVIETRKDQISKLRWKIKPKDDSKEQDARCKKIAEFLNSPDQEHTWNVWLRMVMEELLVTDAPTIYPRKTLGGDLYALELVDGGTIKRVIDETGRTPLPPQPAYQQVLKGLPAVDYSRDELIYAPRNPRVHKIYGYSPVEQIVMTVNIALRRSLHQLQYYTEGNIPEALIGVPEEWNPDQIKQFQDYWDSLLEGNTGARRHAKFVPGGLKIQETKPNALKDDFDEWLARVVCFAFSVAPTPFIKSQNRATADNAQQQSLSEGLAPLMNWSRDLMNLVLAKYFNAPDLEFNWDQEESIDPLVQAQINQIYVATKVLHPDEVRADLGLDPLTPAQKEELNPPPPPMLTGPDDDPEADPPPEDKAKLPPEPKEALGKAKKALAPIDRERESIAREQAKLQKKVKAFLKDKATSVIAQVIAGYSEAGKMSASDAIRVARILSDLDFQDWSALAGDVQKILETISKDGATVALAQIGIVGDDSSEYAAIVTQANEKAIEYAKERSAELVGMKYVDGELVENPNAEWRIDESTRDMIQSDVARAMDEGMSNDDLAALLEENYAFSPERAENIARTETAFADVAGNMAGYRASGQVESKKWLVGDGCCDECQLLDGVVVGLDEDFPNGGGDGPPLHPQCRCDVSPVLSEPEQEQDQ